MTVVNARVDALSQDAKARRTAIEARVAELQAEAKASRPRSRPSSTRTSRPPTDTYADLAKRGETLVARIRKPGVHQGDRGVRQDHRGQGEDHQDPGHEDRRRQASSSAKKADTGTAAKKTAANAGQGRDRRCRQGRQLKRRREQHAAPTRSPRPPESYRAPGAAPSAPSRLWRRLDVFDVETWTSTLAVDARDCSPSRSSRSSNCAALLGGVVRRRGQAHQADLVHPPGRRGGRCRS